MKKNGYFGIGAINMKTSDNYGTLFRSAQILGADFVFLIGCRFKRQASDTMRSWRHVPTFVYKDFQDFNDHRPYDCPLVSVEILDSGSTPIKGFVHPKKAIYLLGAEDTGIPAEALAHSQHFVQLPGERSMNVAVAGSIVMFDRINKQ